MTRQPAQVRTPVVLTVAGSDSGGGAGIQADLKTVEAGGAFGTSAVTSVTAQHTRGVEGTHGVPVPDVEAQIDAVVDDFDVAAAKTGMLGRRPVVEAVAERAGELPNLVVDPVMVATSGDRLLEPEAEAAYEALVERATLVTPNADEAEVLTGVAVTDAESAREAGERLVAMGADAALVTGGHAPGEEVADVLVDGESTRTYRHDRVDTAATHGSGCTLSSAIATRLAHGDDLPAAVGEGVSLLSRAVRYGLDVGEGPGSVHHLVDVRNEARRDDTVESVERLVCELDEQDATWLVPPDGAAVAGATPYAESARDVAAADAPLEPTGDGPRGRNVRFGAAGRLGRLLLAVREAAPAVRFAVACRADAVERGGDALPGPVVECSSGEDGSVGALAGRLPERLADQSGSPAAVLDEDGSEGRAALLAPDADALVDRVEALLATAER